MQFTKAGISFFCTLLLIYIFNHSIGGAVPFRLGYFLSPFHGFWQNAEPENREFAEKTQLSGLKEAVNVVTDENQVPHIFAKNDEDLAYTQGYVTARDRLWQMEFQTHAAAGRLSEVIGEKTLQIDKDMRHKGLAWSAEIALKEMQKTPEVKALLDAYSKGVNDYIHQLTDANLPLEYKILNYKPEDWTPLKTSLLLKFMALTLTSKNEDLELTNAMTAFGKEDFALLYPEVPITKDPIIPEGTPWNFENPYPIDRDLSPKEATPKKPSTFKPKPKQPKQKRIVQPDGSILIIGEVETEKPENQNVANYAIPENLRKMPSNIVENPNKGWGSNNWAVAPSKSKNNSAMLANDPHLGLSFPSIWYELQLQTPDLNVYGVSLPGAPSIIIGFNDSISWGVTNASRDVLDYYKVKFKDKSKDEYFGGGKWKLTDKRVETIKIKGDDPVIDTVYYTEMGPVIEDEQFGSLAVRWMAHEPSNESLTFYELNRAKNYGDYVNAISHYVCPAQNFIFASRKGDIAIWQQGKFVNKYRQQGMFVLDGADSLQMWKYYIPQDQNPHILNPERGYVSSANQAPTDATYPYYYNSGEFETFRNRRLNTRLDSIPKVSMDDMKALQQDVFGLLAKEALPLMLSELDINTLKSERKIMYDSLKRWNYDYNKDYISPSVFDAWWYYVKVATFSDEFEKHKVRLAMPDNGTMLLLLRDSAHLKYYDNITTKDTEERRAIINQAFVLAIDSMKRYSGDISEWKWQNIKNTTIRHLTRSIDAFNMSNVAVGGNRGILNANAKYWGPSWRMVVGMGSEIEAYGTYPGGQSGNPGSLHYDDFVSEWAEGQYRKLWFMTSVDDGKQKPLAKEVFTK